MEFKIRSESFKQAVIRVADAVLSTDRSKIIRCWAKLLTFEASSKALTISAFGDEAMIRIILSQQKDEYYCIGCGAASISAPDFIAELTSVPDGCQLSICANNSQIKLAMESNISISLSASVSSYVYTKTKYYHLLSEHYDSEATVHRESFLRGMKKVKYAMAKSEIMICCQCTLFEAWDNTMRLTAGDGSRFAIYTILDCNPLILTPKKIFIIFPKQNINNLIRVFDQSVNDVIQIRYANNAIVYNRRKQIVLKADNIIMVIYGQEDFGRYPNIEKVLRCSYPYQITIDAKAWSRITKKIHLAQSNYKDYRSARLSADLQKGCFDVRINSDSSFLEHMDFILGHYIVDRTKERHYQPWFSCMSEYIEEIAQKGYQDGNVLVSFEDQAILDTIPEGKPLRLEPVLFSYPEKVNKEGITEKLEIFMGVSTVW
jgi:DNA polymerase III sliding clamp (beta) subunit (PCNA family)